MKKHYSLWMACMAACMLLWFAGCSNDGEQPISGPVGNSGSESMGSEPDFMLDASQSLLSSDVEDMAVSLTCCVRPNLLCLSSTDTSITIRICAGSTGAPRGFLIQWYAVPEGGSCPVAFPASGVPTASIYTSTGFAPYACIVVTLRGLECGTSYAFRAQAVNQYNCASPFSEQICCTTAECEETPPPCFDVPTISCGVTTSDAVTVHICAGPSGATGGVELQYAVLTTGTACGSFAWPVSGVAYVNTTPLGANGCTDVTLPNLDCNTTYVFRAKAKACGVNCESAYTSNLCCTTDECEQLPCIDTPSVACHASTDSSITVRICAGPSGAPCGLVLKWVELPADDSHVSTISCAGLEWPETGEHYASFAALGPNCCVYYTVTGLDCETTYAFKVGSFRCAGYVGPCDADYSTIICCHTDECEEEIPCVYTPGYCGSHPEFWTTSSLQIGTNTYSREQLINNLNTVPGNNALSALSKQLITAKLNVLRGATNTTINQIISQGNTLVGNRNINTAYVAANSTLGRTMASNTRLLTLFNSGNSGVACCR